MDTDTLWIWAQIQRVTCATGHTRRFDWLSAPYPKYAHTLAHSLGHFELMTLLGSLQCTWSGNCCHVVSLFAMFSAILSLSLSLSLTPFLSLFASSVLLSTLALFVVLVAPAVNCLINWQWHWHLLRSRPSGKSESVARVKRGACNCVRVNGYDSWRLLISI